ncbi:MAG TPA: PH domain-containing protein [bacterium]|nr:PH domain-containing protein [bacterium]
MRAPVLNLFKLKKKNHENAPGKGREGHGEDLLRAMPSWGMVLVAYGLALGFCWVSHQFFLWFPPYLREVFKNLRGLPVEWADLGLDWAERGLAWIAWGAAVYHQLWQLGTRYRLTAHDIQVEHWFPFRQLISIPYGAVRRLGFTQGPVGMIFQFGHVELDTGSPQGPVLLVNCPRPRQFIQALQPKVESILQPHLGPHRRAGDTA